MTSIRRWLLAALLAALAVAGLAAAAATYFSARDEVDTLLDEELRQVALSLRDHAVLDLRRLESVAANPDQRVLVQIWDPAFDRPYVSRIVGSGPMPRTDEGYATILHDGRPWRAFTLFTGRQLIQVAQPTALRTELAARTAWRLLLPVLVLLPFLGLAGWWIVGRGLAPLGRIAGAVKERSPTALTPVSTSGMPGEIRPLADALNDLLGRLDHSFSTAAALRRRRCARAAHAADGAQSSGPARRTCPDRRGPDPRLRAAATGHPSGHPTGTAAADDGPPRSGRGSGRSGRRSMSPHSSPQSSRMPVHWPPSDPSNCRATMAAGHRRCRGSEDALRILLNNLIDNAVRYTPGGGRVTTSVARDADTVQVLVEDTGPGIPEEERDRVFDRFYRGQNAGATGTGLGLAIVSQVAEMHRGRVALEASEGGGLRVRVRLPLAVAEGGRAE